MRCRPGSGRTYARTRASRLAALLLRQCRSHPAETGSTSTSRDVLDPAASRARRRNCGSAAHRGLDPLRNSASGHLRLDARAARASPSRRPRLEVDDALSDHLALATWCSTDLRARGCGSAAPRGGSGGVIDTKRTPSSQPCHARTTRVPPRSRPGEAGRAGGVVDALGAHVRVDQRTDQCQVSCSRDTLGRCDARGVRPSRTTRAATRSSTPPCASSPSTASAGSPTGASPRRARRPTPCVLPLRIVGRTHPRGRRARRRRVAGGHLLRDAAAPCGRLRPRAPDRAQREAHTTRSSSSSR